VENRQEWERRGEEIVTSMLEKAGKVYLSMSNPLSH
jgi:hypothetical protein